MNRYLTFILNIALLWSGHEHAQCQSPVMTDCLSAFQVEFPLDTTAFKELVSDSGGQHPVLRYMSEDQFTYWYSIKANASDTLRYTVFPTNATDQFQTVLYQYNDTSFCKDFVHGRIEEKDAVQNAVTFEGASGTSPVQSNKTYIEKGQRYYLSVLSLNEDYCGHLMDLVFGNAGIRLHAMNKPCYNFSALEFDLSTEAPIETDDDPALELSMQEDSARHNQPDESNDVIVEFPREETTEEQVESTRREAKLPTLTENNKQLREPQLIDLDLNEGDKLDLDNVFFYNNTYAFREESESELKELLQLMEANPEMEIEIGGHSAGNTKNIRPNPMLRNRGAAWNFKGSSKKLSKKRAEAVKTYLVDGGIESRRIKTQGYGDSQKIVENPKTPNDHRRNMRVEISIISAE